MEIAKPPVGLAKHSGNKGGETRNEERRVRDLNLEIGVRVRTRFKYFRYVLI